MEKSWKYLLGSIQISFVILLLTSCSIPKIIVLEDPLTAEEHNNLGVAYEKKGMIELAERELKKAIKKNITWDIPYFNLGNIYYKKGQLDESIKFYKKAIKTNPKNSDAMNNLAYVFLKKNKCKKAYFWIKRAISIRFNENYLDTMHQIERKCFEEY